jgi:hypothetical protein
MKNITWDGRDVDGQAMAWGTHESLGRVRFLSLHFQGSSKARLAPFAKYFLEHLRNV